MRHADMSEHKGELLAKFKRVETQMRTLQKLVEADADYGKIATSLAQSRRILDKAYHELFGGVIRRAVADPKKNWELLKDEAELIAEALARFG
ncbi:MAG: metal-sensing transcriptional repressor [Proteobacteria bacterium]|nr:metal-sensing transcriptional repressor [Pseudomonadota bacterium]MDE3208895.1 metal-sensing transcriptional repressor [Pseudomonadota bacterium]